MCEHVFLRAQDDRNSCVCGCRRAAIKNDYEGRCSNPSPMADELPSLCTTDDEFFWLIVAELLLFNMHYTLLVLKPYFIDPIIHENVCSKKDPTYVVDRVVRWSRAHLVRVLINKIAFAVCIYIIVY